MVNIKYFTHKQTPKNGKTFFHKYFTLKQTECYTLQASKISKWLKINNYDIYQIFKFQYGGMSTKFWEIKKINIIYDWV